MASFIILPGHFAAGTNTMPDLSDAEFADAAKLLNCSVAAIKAVAKVESRGGGFDHDGRPTILYEAHVFHRLTGGVHAGAKDRYGVALSVPSWDRTLYGASGAHQYERLDDAAALNHDAASMACSWGRFQVLGANWSILGYSSLAAFLNDTRTPAGHLGMFAQFVLHNGLDDELRRHDWPGFARGYNGPRYAENQYDARMAVAFNELA
jgi:hypothetical protein